MSKIIVDQVQKAGGSVLSLPSTYAANQIMSVDANGNLIFINKDLPILYGASNPTKTTNPSALGQTFINTTTGELLVCVDSTTNANRWYGYFGSSVNIPQGQTLFDTVGTNSFVVPSGVTSISAVLVGAGGGGHPTWSNPAGGGGALAYANVPVTPGETLTVTVGAGGVQGGHGGDTLIYRGATLLFKAEGGKYGSTSTRAAPVSGLITANGGRGGLCSTSGYGGGGGAGGYSGDGGDGSYGAVGTSATNGGQGFGGSGAGGTGYQSSTNGFGGGGGVGLLGEGASGLNQASLPDGNTWSYTSSTNNGYGGKGGSGGEQGSPNSNTSQTFYSRTTYHGEGGKYGGGGAGGGSSVTNNATFCKGGQGGARIIWGANRSYPKLNTADMTTIL